MFRVQKINNQSGLTLLEMLVTISILAAVSFISTVTYSKTHQEANDRLVRAEMMAIGQALRKFKQDTGYYPKTGFFDLTSSGGVVPYANLPSHSGATIAAQDRWFYSPANLWQLRTRMSPLAGTTHQLEGWDPETGRGWRGPYLTGFVDGFVDIRDGINNGDADGAPGGDPLAGINIEDVNGLADPFEARTELASSGDTLLDWSNTPGGTERRTWGRPYLIFDLKTKPYIISLGPDGDYGTIDDIKLDVE